MKKDIKALIAQQTEQTPEWVEARQKVRPLEFLWIKYTDKRKLRAALQDKYDKRMLNKLTGDQLTALDEIERSEKLMTLLASVKGMQYGERLDRAYFEDRGYSAYEMDLIERNKVWHKASLKEGEGLSWHVTRAYIVHGESVREIAFRQSIRVARVTPAFRRGLDFYNEVNCKEGRKKLRGLGVTEELL